MIAKSLPQRPLPAAVLACFKVDKSFGSKGIGKRWLATALRDCHNASERFALFCPIENRRFSIKHPLGKWMGIRSIWPSTVMTILPSKVQNKGVSNAT